jgi:hypothetical protein
MDEDAKSDDETLVYESEEENGNSHLNQQQEDESEGEIDYGEEGEEGETVIVSDYEDETNENGFVNTNYELVDEDDLPPLVPANADQIIQNIIMQPVQHFPNMQQNVNYLSSDMPESGDMFYTWTFTYEGSSVNLYSPLPQTSSFVSLMSDDSYMEELVHLARERLIEKKLKTCIDLLHLSKTLDGVEFEIPKGTTDSILYEEFQKDDDIYILDDCFTNFHRFETLEQLFTVQKSNLNPNNQLPIQRIIKFKAKII